MTTTASSWQEAELERCRWDLSPLLEGKGEDSLEELLEQAQAEAERFAKRYRGRVAALERRELAEAMRSLAGIVEAVGRASSYALLSFSTDTANPSRGALLARVQERATELQSRLLFFELEWAALPDQRAEELLGPGEELDFCRHHLRSLRRLRPHLLSEPEELVLTKKELTSATAWSRLFEELTAGIAVPVEGERLVLDSALAELHSPSRERRRLVAERITAALQEGLRTRAYIFNTLILDKAIEDRLRRYPHWLAARNLANEVSDAAVETLLEAVRSRYELARRWYRLKAKLLGVERLEDYDRMAAVGEDEVRMPFAAGRELVLSAYADFSHRLGEVARALFRERHIDAPPQPNKRGGAFAAATVPAVKPYVLLNYTGRRRDVLTLAHELGHAVHFALAAPRGVFHHHTPLTLSETASVFGEAIVFDRLLAQDHDPASRLALLAENIEDRIATVFRQVAMNRFEELVHNERREREELSVDRFGELWEQSQREFMGDSVVLTEGYRAWWSYIPHFIDTPGYVYAYAFGQLLALAIFRRYREAGPPFVERYLALLEAGGSLPPEELAAIVDCDLSAPDFWEGGLDLIEEQLTDAEAAAQILLGQNSRLQGKRPTDERGPLPAKEEV